MNPINPTTRRHFSAVFTTRRAFSIIELLVVISIIALLTAISFPFLKNSLQSTAVNAAAGQVSNALSAARVYATRDTPFISAKRVGSTLRTAQDNGDGYSGTIVLFAPDNSLRIMENDQNAYDPSNLGTSDGWLELQVPALNGYTPLAEFEDIRYPGRVQMLGIVRTGVGPYDVQLLPPPFAIRFNADGTIGQGVEDSGWGSGGDPDWDRVVFVSPTGNVRTVGSGPNAIVTTDYDVREERSDLGNNIDLGDFGREGELLMPDGRVQLPFGSIETVSGVLVIEPERVPGEFENPATNADQNLNFERDRVSAYSQAESAALMNWAADNPTYARILLFNPYTGQDLTR
ncbi:MAG: prepilin-type N-terminal cleavage/methylation domain-containing protein [Planctomycetota bacterium]